MKRIAPLLLLFVLMATAAFPGTVRQRILYGTLVIFEDTLKNAQVTITLSGNDYFTTGDGQTIAPGQVVLHADASGFFRQTVWGSDSLFPALKATYSVEVKHPLLQFGGMNLYASQLEITASATDADSISLGEILAQ